MDKIPSDTQKDIARSNIIRRRSHSNTSSITDNNSGINNIDINPSLRVTAGDTAGDTTRDTAGDITEDITEDLYRDIAGATVSSTISTTDEIGEIGDVFSSPPIRRIRQ